MKRCVVNLATGRYQAGQKRLAETLQKVDPDSQQFFWSYIPEGIPSHQEKPYAFKAHLLSRAASAGAELLMWMDAAVLPIRSMEPLWEKIEKDGAWIPLNGWTNYEWCADSAYPDLFPGVPIENAREINKTVPHAVATAFGMNLNSEIGKKLLDEYCRLANTNAFCGPWSNVNCPQHWAQHPDRVGPCGPSDVLGHRHDQTALSVIAWRLGLTLSQCPEWFAYPPPAENTVLLAVGA